MTYRAVLLGLLLSLLISVGTYFNDWIIGQTQLIGNHLPISVFGLAAFLVLVINPLLRWLSPKLPFVAAEVAMITALGLLACGFPGSNFFRTFTHVAALPSHWLKTRAAWQSTNVMSYVPGGSAELGQGHVRDFKKLALRLKRGREAAQASPAGRLWSLLPPSAQRAFVDSESASLDANRVSELTLGLNDALRSPAFYDAATFRGLDVDASVRPLLGRSSAGLPSHEIVRRNRALLVAAMPDLVLAPPVGQGVLFDGGRADPFAVDTLVQGRSKSSPLGVRQLPWAKWWPTLYLWGGAALALSVAALCLALIVHPQWSKRELLPYPIARFIEETAQRKAGSFLPEVAKSKLFWLGCGSLLALHLLNGLHAWFNWVPEIPRNYDFWALGAVFPNAVRVGTSYGYFGPTFYVSVIAFSFFMSTSVSFSLGISQILFLALGAALLSHGIQLESGAIDAKATNLLRFGSYSAIFGIILYTGREYYANVIRSVFGRGGPDTPPYVVRSARVLLVAVVLATVIVRSAGLSWTLAAGFVLFELVLFVVMTRIVTETGAFFMQASWTFLGVLAALVGFDAVGPTAYITLCIASQMLFIDARELLMPFVSNALKLADRKDGPTPERAVPWFGLVIVAGACIAGVTTLYLEYNHGLTQVGNPYATDWLPTFAFDGLSQELSNAAARGTLAQATAAHGTQSLALLKINSGAYTWVLVGLVLALGAAIGRLRLAWWPLHPVAFLVWGTYPMTVFGPSFLIGWLVKATVTGTSGASGYHTFRPLMVGVIAGELLAGLFWMSVGASYYFVTGRAPVTYNIFPG